MSIQVQSEYAEQSYLPRFVQMKLTRLGENFKTGDLEFQIGLEDWRDGSMLDCEVVAIDRNILREAGPYSVAKELRRQVERYKNILEAHGVY